MEYNMESNLAHKRTFMDFLDQDIGQGIYMDKIRSMIAQGRQRLLIDLTDLRNFNNDLARRLLQSPSEYIQPFKDAVEEVTRSIDPKYFLDIEELHIGFTGQFGFHKVTPRELLSPFLGSMICVLGIVTKCSLVRPKVVKSVHYCPTTGDFMNREYRDITAPSGFPTGSIYPTRDDQGNLLVTEFGLSKYRDHQTMSIQEMPENSAPGQLPRSVDVIVEDDLVDTCKPGDRVAIVGIYKAIPGKSKGSTSGVFRTVVVANNVSQLNKEANTPIFTNEDIKNIKKIGHRQDAFDLLAESLASSIYGHSWIKKAVILQLLGGVEKNLKNGTHIRGDINVMMVGDPSVAKSQLLRAIMNIAPLAISTTGRGSSGVGLTAAVTSDQETGERRLEAGAMVLADRGVVCIDEFDKMSDLDRVSIHEVMEQQTVTIAKAGIHASLNARCSVVAAANPIYGTYDRSLTPTRNIGLPDSLLSRFDLLFIVLDQMDADIDRHISEHVLRMHRFRGLGDAGVSDGGMRITEEEELDTATSIYVKYNRLLHGEKRSRHGRRETVTIKFLKKYIHYAKSRHQPVLTEEASEKIAVAYAEMRNSGSENRTGGTLPITARTLETIIRLSAAHAKLKLQNQVTKADVDAALKVMNFAIYHKELTEMEEREQEREMEMERKRQADGGNDGPNGGNRDDADENGDGRQTSRRQRRRSGGGMPGNQVDDIEPRSDAGNANGVDHVTEDTQMDGDEAQPVNGLQTSFTDGHQVDVDMEISSERTEEFNLAFAHYITTTRAESVSIDSITLRVNSGRIPFAQEEISYLLQRLQAANRIMIVGDTVHIV